MSSALWRRASDNVRSGTCAVVMNRSVIVFEVLYLIVWHFTHCRVLPFWRFFFCCYQNSSRNAYECWWNLELFLILLMSLTQSQNGKLRKMLNAHAYHRIVVSRIEKALVFIKIEKLTVSTSRIYKISSFFCPQRWWPSTTLTITSWVGDSSNTKNKKKARTVAVVAQLPRIALRCECVCKRIINLTWFTFE